MHLPFSPPSSSPCPPYSLYKSDHTLDFGGGGPFRLFPLVSRVLSLHRFLSALEVLPNKLSPLPTHFPWLTPSDAPQRSPAEYLSDTDAIPLPYLVPCSDLWTNFFPISLELWHVCPHRQYPTNGEHGTFILASLGADSKCYSLDGMNKWILHFYHPPSTVKWPLHSKRM